MTYITFLKVKPNFCCYFIYFLYYNFVQPNCETLTVMRGIRQSPNLFRSFLVIFFRLNHLIGPSIHCLVKSPKQQNSSRSVFSKRTTTRSSPGLNEWPFELCRNIRARHFTHLRCSQLLRKCKLRMFSRTYF